MSTHQGIQPVATPDYIDDVFKPGGVLALAKPGYVLRPEQVQLARGVEHAFNTVKPMLAEAPTGVGKSFAYLVPATRHASEHGHKVVVMTANIALQEQIVGRDLPFLAEHLPWKFTFALAKGWSNYLCFEALDASRNEQLKGRRLPVLQDQQQLEAAIAWADVTEKGDVSELPFELGVELKPRLTIAKEDCLGGACDFYDRCHPRAARAALDLADVIVSNYHLGFADLAAKESSGHGVLPAYRLAVLDEGHKAADIARDFFGERVTPGSVGRAVSLLDAKGRRAEKLQIPARLDPELRQLCVEQADRLFVELSRLKRDERRYKARLDQPGMFDASELVVSLGSAARELERAKARGGLSPEGRHQLDLAAARCSKIASALKRASLCEDEADWIYSLDATGRGDAVALMAVPFSMADYLRSALFEREVDPVGVVVTSATLTTSQGAGAFDFVATQLGCEEADELVVGSPFDYSKTCLVVPRIDPPSNSRDSTWLDQMADSLLEAVQLAGGRTLGLFTSYKALKYAHETLVAAQQEGDLDGVCLLRQGDAPRSQLLARFREDEASVLLGCESFWEGVDVPGPSLSCVFIDRIPFPHVLDPVADAHAARDSKSFMRYQVPLATIMIRQGFGRLVRSVEDGGLVVVADSRLVDKPYGRHLVRQLPEVQLFRTLQQAKPYLPGR